MKTCELCGASLERVQHIGMRKGMRCVSAEACAVRAELRGLRSASLSIADRPENAHTEWATELRKVVADLAENSHAEWNAALWKAVGFK